MQLNLVKGEEDAMRRIFLVALALCALASSLADGEVVVPSGYSAESLAQNFMGGFDYLPNGDIIGMYTDPNMQKACTLGIIDGNGDGIPAGYEIKYKFNKHMWGAFVRVNPGGTVAVFAVADWGTNYKVYKMKLGDYSVKEIIPNGGSFDGIFDLAFIDDSHCFLSANAAGGTTNKIWHLDIEKGDLTEVISIEGTYSGPVDLDEEGNLYYVRGKGNFPVKPGDFTLLRFPKASLEDAIKKGEPLAESDAEVIASALDGGYDVAWHSSGTLLVSDANNGKVYAVRQGGVVSHFVSLTDQLQGGFTVISLYETEQSSNAEMALGYLPLLGSGEPDVYRITSLRPQLRIMVNATTLSADDGFILTVFMRPTTVSFDAYIVIAGPGGTAYSALPGNRLVPGVEAYASAVPGLAQEVKVKAIEKIIPDSAPEGKWTIYAGAVPTGRRPSVANAIALDTLDIMIEP